MIVTLITAAKSMTGGGAEKVRITKTFVELNSSQLTPSIGTANFPIATYRQPSRDSERTTVTSLLERGSDVDFISLGPSPGNEIAN